MAGPKFKFVSYLSSHSQLHCTILERKKLPTYGSNSRLYSYVQAVNTLSSSLGGEYMLVWAVLQGSGQKMAQRKAQASKETARKKRTQ